ncbi:MAG: hypothetical protein K6F64_01715 [Clostridia bacterium]|nr:hypothetical protein [Clostridia bacterium]
MIKTFVSFLTVIFTFLYSTGFAQNSAVNWALDVPVYEGGSRIVKRIVNIFEPVCDK